MLSTLRTLLRWPRRALLLPLTTPASTPCPFCSPLLPARTLHQSAPAFRHKRPAPRNASLPWDSLEDATGEVSRIRDKSAGSKKPFQHSPARKPTFQLPLEPSVRLVAKRLRRHVRVFAEKEQIPSRLVAYGVRGPAVRNLFSEAASGEQGAHASSYTPHLDDEGVATSLLDHWATNAELALPTSDEIGGSTDLWDLETIRRAFSVDASRALDRACMNSFLSWIRTSLRNSTAKAGEGSEAAKEAASTLAHLDLLCDAADLTLPAYQYPLARTLTRQIHLHVGPTNSGKTHGALLALCKARTGVYAGPLRLLAHEVWERINEGTVSPGVAARACNLITGEEQRIVDPYCGLYSCTVEMANVERPVEVAVVDEIQMIGDSQRGYAWTGAVLGLPAKEVHLCGEASVIPLLERMADACGDVLHIHEYKRLTPLSIAEESLGSDLGKVRKGDCVVTFSRSNIFALKREIEQKTGLRCAVAYGGLPPETKSEQARLFNNPDSGFDVMVASDAIGMGLNLKIKRVIFETLSKWNGEEVVSLSASQIKQIAGRAGRYGTGDDAGGFATTLAPKDLEILRLALDAPIVPVSRAAIQPSSDSLAAISQLLPSGPSESPARSRFARASSLSNLYSDIALLSNVDSASYFLSDFAQQHAISPLVERRSRGRLTVSEREKFANAPANTRDERVVAILGNFIEAYGRGELVRFEDAAADLGMLEALEDMLALREEARAIRAERLGRTLEEDAALDTTPVATPGIATSAGAPSSNPSFGIRPTSSGPTLASYLPPSHRLLSTNTLMVLESLHRSLSLYLWLSFRFSLAFCHRQDVERMKVQAEKAIEFCLEGIRFGRATRMSAAERKAERKESEDGPAEPRFGQAQAQAQASQGPVASGAEVSV